LVIGIGKILRELSAEEIVGIQAGTASYIEKGRLYRTHLRRIA
jgi:hypothetical protein